MCWRMTARFESKIVNNGFGAGMLAKEYHPDLIILDVMLPDINGQAVCELIRQDPTMSDIKIICISGMVEEDKIAELKKASVPTIFCTSRSTSMNSCGGFADSWI